MIRSILVHCQIVVLLLGLLLPAKAQDYYHMYKGPNTYSPTAASLGTYGNIPVSLFNGQANIEVPLHTISYRGIEVPISLVYNTSGIRVDQQPGWVGLGWSLSAGGAIVRNCVMNPDEDAINNEFALSNYYEAKDKMGVADWKTKPSLGIDDAPDEFTFNFLGNSGSFYLDHTGQWQVKSKDNTKYRIEHTIKYNYEVTDNTGAHRVSVWSSYHQFILTDNKGVKYYFGGDSLAVEYSMMPIGVYDRDNPIANSWNLTKIETPKGDVVTFKYVREVSRTHVNYSLVFFDNYFNRPTEASPAPVKHQNATRCVGNFMSLLQSISINQFTTVTFNKSICNSLSFPPPNIMGRTFYSGDPEISAETITPELSYPDNFTFFKLNDVVVKNKEDVIIKKINLYYLESSTQRLKLSEVVHESPQVPIYKYGYKFDYNPLPLPAYGSAKEDHWGFYNGRSFWTSSSNVGADIPDPPTYSASREPDSVYMQAEMLTQITFPTGGTSQLIYEPHTYSQYVEQNPISLKGVTGNAMAGGLRIRKIVNRNKANELLEEKEYFYVKNFLTGGTVSSGILSSGKPAYYFTGYRYNRTDWNFVCFSSDPFNGNNTTNGNHITYSEVVERTNGNGYVVNKYSNHDNGFLDKAPFYFQPDGIYNSTYGKPFVTNFGKLDLERGLLLEKRFYNENKIQIRSEVQTYNNDSNRYEEYVRSQVTENIEGAIYTIYRFPLFTFWPYLKTKEVSTYDNSGSLATSILTEYSYDYSNRLLLEEKSRNSKGDTTRIKYVYPPHRTTTPIFSDMTNINQIADVIEKETLLNSLSVSAEKLTYTNPFTKIYVPGKVEKRFGSGPYETAIEFLQYDNRGNVLSYKKDDGIVISGIYDVNKINIVAEATNANPNQIAYTSFEDGVMGVDGGWTFTNHYRNEQDYRTGRKSYPLYYGPITISGLNGATNYVISYWAKNGSATIPNTTLTTGATQNGWTYYEHRNTAFVSDLTISGNAAVIDELRLFPVNAQMSSYTYYPLVGQLSSNSQNNNTTTYEYDEFNRLSLLRDQDGNIKNRFQYAFQSVLHTDAIWVSTGVTRCMPCSLNTSYNTNIRQREEKDTNPNSITYNQSRWINIPNDGYCLDYYGWANTNTPLRCRKNSNNQFTGEQEQEQKDMNPCSPTYNQTRWVVIRTDLTACPLCPNCPAPAYKCLNYNCEEGIKVYTGTFGYDPKTGMYKCYYYYEFSDGSISALQFEWSDRMCDPQ